MYEKGNMRCIHPFHRFYSCRDWRRGPIVQVHVRVIAHWFAIYSPNNDGCEAFRPRQPSFPVPLVIQVKGIDNRYGNRWREQKKDKSIISSDRCLDVSFCMTNLSTYVGGWHLLILLHQRRDPRGEEDGKPTRQGKALAFARTGRWKYFARYM